MSKHAATLLMSLSAFPPEWITGKIRTKNDSYVDILGTTTAQNILHIIQIYGGLLAICKFAHTLGCSCTAWPGLSSSPLPGVGVAVSLAAIERLSYDSINWWFWLGL